MRRSRSRWSTVRLSSAPATAPSDRAARSALSPGTTYHVSSEAVSTARDRGATKNKNPKKQHDGSALRGA